MTTNAHKAAARRHQAEHPGTPLPVALRATAQPVSLDPLRGAPDAGSSVTRDVLQACLGLDLSAEDLQAFNGLVRQGRQDRPITMLADQLTQARALGWRTINCASSPITHAANIENVTPQDFSHFARTLVQAREAELRHLNVNNADQLPPNSPMRKILLFIDPDTIDTAALGPLSKDQTLGISVHLAQLPGAGETNPTFSTAAQWLGLDQPVSGSGGNGPHRALMGEARGAGKALRYHKAFAVFFDAGCKIAPTEDGIAFTVTAPADMTREEFQELTQRAWA